MPQRWHFEREGKEEVRQKKKDGCWYIELAFAPVLFLKQAQPTDQPTNQPTRQRSRVQKGSGLMRSSRAQIGKNKQVIAHGKLIESMVGRR